jgi:hypothetical protein
MLRVPFIQLSEEVILHFPLDPRYERLWDTTSNNEYLTKGVKDMPDPNSNDRSALSVLVTLGAAGGAGEEGIGVTARDDDEDFDCARNQPLTFSFIELPSLDMALRTVCLTREGSGP